MQLALHLRAVAQESLNALPDREYMAKATMGKMLFNLGTFASMARHGSESSDHLERQ